MRISDWSSDVCSSDLRGGGRRYYRPEDIDLLRRIRDLLYSEGYTIKGVQRLLREGRGKDAEAQESAPCCRRARCASWPASSPTRRSEEHTSELQSLMRIPYAVFCLKNKSETLKAPHPHRLSLNT